MTVRLEESKDGSHTLFSTKFNQYYHNPNGAIAESLHIFFGQSDILKKLELHEDIKILEVGFGTGLNVLLLCDLMAELNSRSTVLFQSIEAWPVSTKVASKFNFGQFLKHRDASGRLVDIFKTLTEESVDVHLTESIRLKVFRGFFDDFDPEESGFNYVFHDAFSPQVNTELWTTEVFGTIFNWCSPDAVLTTYCAATKARNAMKEAGWEVHKAPGALGKREMSVAVRGKSG